MGKNIQIVKIQREHMVNRVKTNQRWPLSYPSRTLNNTVRPNSVAGFAGHVRLERPIDSSSDKTVCAPKVAEKGPYKGGTLGFINKPLTDPDFCSCRQVIRSALFPGNLGNSCGISCFLHQKFTDHIPQFMPLIIHRHYVTFAHMGELIL